LARLGVVWQGEARNEIRDPERSASKHMHKTKIDYAEYTWNPVWGCRNGCEYCYARRTAERFGQSFEPHWKEENFQRSMPRKPSIIFVNSMSDICWWEEEWVNKVLSRIANHPEHIFLLLTKLPTVYSSRWWTDLPENGWRGFTATTDEEAISRQTYMYGFDRVWCSAEPLLGPIESLDPGLVKWLVVGAMTGTGAKPVWWDWFNTTMKAEMPTFVKNNIPEGYRDAFHHIREYPPEMLEYLGREK